VRPDVRRNDWLRFDDEVVTPVEYADVIADAYGGSQRRRRKRSRSDSSEITAPMEKRRHRDFFRRLFSLLRLFRRVSAMLVGTSPPSVAECGSGYGGRTSSAYMIQYARRSEVPKLYFDEHEQ